MGVINLGALIEKLKTKLVASGFVKNTDYASSSKGGVIKTSSTYATAVTSGALKASVKTAEEYEALNDNAFVSKGTLDNVLAAKPAGSSYELLADSETDIPLLGTFSLPNSGKFTDYQWIKIFFVGSAAVGGAEFDTDYFTLNMKLGIIVPDGIRYVTLSADGTLTLPNNATWRVTIYGIPKTQS